MDVSFDEEEYFRRSRESHLDECDKERWCFHSIDYGRLNQMTEKNKRILFPSNEK